MQMSSFSGVKMFILLFTATILTTIRLFCPMPEGPILTSLAFNLI